MKRFIEGADRSQVSLLPGCADDYVGTDNPGAGHRGFCRPVGHARDGLRIWITISRIDPCVAFGWVIKEIRAKCSERRRSFLSAPATK